MSKVALSLAFYFGATIVWKGLPKRTSVCNACQFYPSDSQITYAESLGGIPNDREVDEEKRKDIDLKPPTIESVVNKNVRKLLHKTNN